MAVHSREIVPGEFFMSHDRELRKVARLAFDAEGRLRVWYQRKSATLPTQPLLFGHGQADAPYLEDFVAECDYRLSGPELSALRDGKVLLEDE